MTTSHPPQDTAPRLGEGLSLRRMPAHWMLGRLGKRAMRPGGFAPSERMIGELGIGPADDVLEMWPGLGRTTSLALAGHPASYVGIERGEAEAARARAVLDGPDRRCIVAPTHRSGLPDGCGSVVYGEALLTLEPAPRKVDIVHEAARLLRPGGRYAVHELLLSIRNSVMFLGRAVSHPEVLPRLATMLRTFHRYRDNIGAITIVAERPPAP